MAVRARGATSRRWLSPLPAVELGVLALLLVAPPVLSAFQLSFMTRVLLLVLFALSFDLIWGFAGIFSLGQAVFFGWGGYIAGLLATRQDITSMFITIPAAMLTGLVLAVALGIFLFSGRRRVSLIYVALATLATSYASERLAASWQEIGAANGIPSIPAMTLGESRFLPGLNFYYLALTVAVAVYLLFRFVVRSQFGLALYAGRSDLERVTFLGYRTARMQAIVFALSGAVAGMAGGLYAFHEGFVSPSLLGVVLSTQAVLWVLFGGVGTLIGPVVGVVIIEVMGLELADRFPRVWPIILGGILLFVILFLRDGIIGLVLRREARTLRFGGRLSSLHTREPEAHGDAAA